MQAEPRKSKRNHRIRTSENSNPRLLHDAYNFELFPKFFLIEGEILRRNRKIARICFGFKTPLPRSLEASRDVLKTWISSEGRVICVSYIAVRRKSRTLPGMVPRKREK